MTRVQIFALMGSLLFLGIIVESIRKRRLREEYSLLWIFFGLLFLLFSLWREGLETLARWAGILYAPAAFFLLLIMSIFALLFHFSVVLSRLTESVTALIQEMGLLKAEAEERLIGSEGAFPSGGREGSLDGDGGVGGEGSAPGDPPC